MRKCDKCGKTPEHNETLCECGGRIDIPLHECKCGKLIIDGQKCRQCHD